MNPLPACCTPLLAHWPLPQPLSGAQLVSTQFDAALLLPNDFAAHQIPAPNGASKRQAEFLAGRLCAREALRQLTGSASTPSCGEDRAPQWPAGISGSITHSHGWAAAVVARDSDVRGLGLDMEKLLSSERAARLAGELLTPSELQRLQELPSEQRAELVTLTFSLKESLFKALYPLVLKRFYFEHAELLEWSADGHARLRLLLDLSEEWRNGVELEGQFSLFDGRLLSLVGIPAH
ncbi:4'-phosphopantetheinyl transferase superfamily protein [Pseudomonas sp. LS44]|uniref:4'-phosphopantetheinyl transferase family protein n=1 Tax=Pseudomonas sp. LS44 TaxID=1357074 RepID=UPI00215A8019|nr:4'-phosphopantetheinyl transferase superfamily protein [Pseudomonas sp. LS44]UVE18972.1 4'-phosphopantetheinyl transferase superfamily protein [Pseudomonas sp. LS44]